MAGGCEIFIEGVVDADAEKQRLEKRREELLRKVTALRGRLASPGYMAKAPPRLVEQTRAELSEAEAELEKA
jgi:valyl-tRNA synthetase